MENGMGTIRVKDLNRPTDTTGLRILSYYLNEERHRSQETSCFIKTQLQILNEEGVKKYTLGSLEFNT